MSDYKSNPNSNYNRASPGIAGALKDAINAVQDAVSPRSLKQRGASMEASVEGSHSEDYLSRMRNGQSSDRSNSY